MLPNGTAQDLLDLVQWPQGKGAILVVGHQPALGQVVARVLGMSVGECAVRKCSVWWLHQSERAGQTETVLLSVQSPEFL